MGIVFVFQLEKTMDSINENMAEDNYEDLHGESARKKIKEIQEKAGSCFFCTSIRTGKPFATRPMAVQELDEEGCFWFLSADDSKKNQELKADPSVQLLFQGSGYTDFLEIYGRASISKDKKKIKDLWNPLFKTWFTEGIDDPRITVIKVEPESGYYWDTKNNRVIGFLKRVTGAVIGKTMDDSIEGKVKV